MRVAFSSAVSVLFRGQHRPYSLRHEARGSRVPYRCRAAVWGQRLESRRVRLNSFPLGGQLGEIHPHIDEAARSGVLAQRFCLPTDMAIAPHSFPGTRG
jgi:hypothetical protein